MSSHRRFVASHVYSEMDVGPDAYYEGGGTEQGSYGRPTTGFRHVTAARTTFSGEPDLSKPYIVTSNGFIYTRRGSLFGLGNLYGSYYYYKIFDGDTGIETSGVEFPIEDSASISAIEKKIIGSWGTLAEAKEVAKKYSKALQQEALAASVRAGVLGGGGDGEAGTTSPWVVAAIVGGIGVAGAIGYKIYTSRK